MVCCDNNSRFTEYECEVGNAVHRLHQIRFKLSILMEGPI